MQLTLKNIMPCYTNRLCLVKRVRYPSAVVKCTIDFLLVWKRIHPRLEVILAKRKTDRLERERLLRVAQRRNELTNILPMLWDNDGVREASKVPAGSTPWSLSMPSTEAHFRSLPSLHCFMEDDSVEVTRELLNSKLDDILPDILLFQMQRRRALVSLLCDTEKHDKPMRNGVMDWGWNVEDREELELNDATNLKILNQPTSLFHLSRPMGRYERIAYPPKVDEQLAYQTAFEGTRLLRMTAQRLLDVIGFKEPTMEALTAKSVVFQCDHCISSGDSWFGWEELVRFLISDNLRKYSQLSQVEHYAQEQRWYEKHKARREREKITSPEWVDTHNTPSVSIIDEERIEDIEDNEGDNESAKRYKCKHCGDGYINAEFRLVRFYGKRMTTLMPANIAVLHSSHRYAHCS